MNIKINWTCIEDDCVDSGLVSNQVEYGSITELLEAIQEAGWPICQDCGQDLDFVVEVDQNV